MLLAVVPGQTRLPPASRSGTTAFAQGVSDAEGGKKLELAEPPPPQEPPPLGAAQAVAWVEQDAAKMDPADRRYMRYIWCPDGKFKAANVGLNVISRGNFPVRAVPLANGHLLRVDSRMYVRFFAEANSPYSSDLEEWLKAWEQLRYDPTFNLLVTKDNVRFAKGELASLPGATRKVKKKVTEKVKKKVDVQPYLAPDGKWHSTKTIEVDEEKEVDVAEDVDFLVLRLDPDYLPALAQLQKQLATAAPIVLDRYFLARAMQTVKVDPVSQEQTAWSVIWGGLYYDFRGIKRSQDKNVTDEDLFLQQFGLGNAAKLFDRLQTDQRAAIFKSDVTGRPRRVDFFNTPSGKAWDVMGVGSVTHDLRQEDTDVGTHPIMNLLKFKDQAREDIFVGPNGMHVYAIFNGAGKLLDEAAINIVSDRTIPSPHPPRLQCALSCIACHETEGSDGWKAVGNDVKKLLGDRVDIASGQRRPDLDIFFDATNKNTLAAINRIAGLYQGDFSRGIRRSRDDYAETILRISGPQGDDQTQIVRTAMSDLTSRTRSYIYDDVTARQALWELGVEPGPEPLKKLRKLLPPEPAKVGFAPEDPRVSALKAGIPIPRTDWAYVQSYCASRVAKNQGRNE